MLHKYGDDHPESGLKNKVKGFQFSQKIEVLDPIKRIPDMKPMKPFMVNQLQMAIERGQLILSPFDETLHKQLVDYEVKKISASGQPVFTDVNEHFVDALGLAFLAFALEFPDIAKTVEKVDFTSKLIGMDNPVTQKARDAIQTIKDGFGAISNPWKNQSNGSYTAQRASEEPYEVDKPQWFRINTPSASRSRMSNWGSRTNFGGGSTGRRMF